MTEGRGEHRLNPAGGLHFGWHSVYGSTVCGGMRWDPAYGEHMPTVPTLWIRL